MDGETTSTTPTSTTRGQRIARILGAFSLCGLVWLGIEYQRGMAHADEVAKRPMWPDKSSDTFLLDAGQKGTWDVSWEAIPDVVGWGVLTVETGFSPSEDDELRILVRLQPADAIPSWYDAEPDAEAWLTLRHTGQLVVDPSRLHAVEYVVERVPPALAGRSGWLAVEPRADLEPGYEALLRRLNTRVGTLIVGVPLLLLLVGSVLVLLRNRSRTC